MDPQYNIYNLRRWPLPLVREVLRRWLYVLWGAKDATFSAGLSLACSGERTDYPRVNDVGKEGGSSGFYCTDGGWVLVDAFLCVDKKKSRRRCRRRLFRRRGSAPPGADQSIHFWVRPHGRHHHGDERLASPPPRRGHRLPAGGFRPISACRCGLSGLCDKDVVISTAWRCGSRLASGLLGGGGREVTGGA